MKEAADQLNPNACFVEKERWYRRLRRWVLQAYWQHQDIIPPTEVRLAPEKFAKDAIINRIEIDLCWADWIRIAFGCQFHVNTIIYCENAPGAVLTSVKTFASSK